MDLDFYNEFIHRSTVELLVITKEPEKYQPAAIEAAERLLRERGVSVADLEAADLQMLLEANAQSAKLLRIDAYREQVASVLEPVLIPNAPFNPEKWFKLFLVIYGLIYAWVLFHVVKSQLDLLDCKGCKGDPTMLGGPINAIFLTVVFFLLLKNRKWGWILLMASNITVVMTAFVQLQVLYKYRHVFSTGPVQYLSPFLLPVLYVLFLWRPAIAAFFGVDVKTKRRTAVVGFAAGLLYCVILELAI
jgi:hypothetical protein